MSGPFVHSFEHGPRGPIIFIGCRSRSAVTATCIKFVRCFHRKILPRYALLSTWLAHEQKVTQISYRFLIPKIHTTLQISSCVIKLICTATSTASEQVPSEFLIFLRSIHRWLTSYNRWMDIGLQSSLSSFNYLTKSANETYSHTTGVRYTAKNSVITAIAPTGISNPNKIMLYFWSSLSQYVYDNITAHLYEVLLINYSVNIP
jgi:hypothetical protein